MYRLMASEKTHHIYHMTHYAPLGDFDTLEAAWVGLPQDGYHSIKLMKDIDGEFKFYAKPFIIYRKTDSDGPYHVKAGWNTGTEDHIMIEVNAYPDTIGHFIDRYRLLRWREDRA